MISRKKYLILFLIALAGVTSDLRANEFTGKVVSVIDGNTIQVKSEKNGIQKIVLQGIDCPEPEQEFGIEAKQFVTKEILNRSVRVLITGKDRSGNYVGVIWHEDDDLRVELLKAGLAWTQEKNPAEDLEGVRKWAQQKGKGLWKNPEATAPWVFRRQRSMNEAKSS